MVFFRHPEGRLREAILAKGLDRRRHELSTRSLAPHRWIGVELVEFSHLGTVGVLVPRLPDNGEGDHSPLPFGDECLLARIGGRDFGSKAINRRLEGLQT